MEFENKIKELSNIINNDDVKSTVTSEAATKNVFIIPFIEALGYDFRKPHEVVPEFTCDIGTKKGEKVDYAILIGKEPVLLIECKHWEQNLDVSHTNQLKRYFGASEAKLGLLTNGISYKFFTDIVKENIMDNDPFFEVDLTNIEDSQIEELKNFHKKHFDIDKIVDSAKELKNTSKIKALIHTELSNPSEQFIRFFASQISSGNITQKKMTEYFIPLVKKSLSMVISDITHESAVNNEKTKATITDTQEGVEISQVKLQALYTIQAFLMDDIEPEKIVANDTKYYFAINIDKKTLCRFYLNTKQQFISISFLELDKDKKDIKYPINSIYDVGKYKEKLRNRLRQLK
jgi:hypothetical protein